MSVDMTHSIVSVLQACVPGLSLSAREREKESGGMSGYTILKEVHADKGSQSFSVMSR